ncbi:MAG: DUF3576 domain-containing protein [Alphaproteobacteria bacterium]|nr:MAG: DUF3576 domain-containing protein [Alphaproteobacteria bacterium]
MKNLLRLIIVGLLSGCAGNVDKTGGTPQTTDDVREAAAGNFLGKGITIGGSREYNGGENAYLGINSYLWQASLDAVQAFPLRSADSNGGMIITEWQTPPESSNERLKVDIHILGKKLTPANLRVRVFRQTRQPKSGSSWTDVPIDKSTNRSMEDTILTNARKLRIQALGG